MGNNTNPNPGGQRTSSRGPYVSRIVSYRIVHVYTPAFRGADDDDDDRYAGQ